MVHFDVLGPSDLVGVLPKPSSVVPVSPGVISVSASAGLRGLLRVEMDVDPATFFASQDKEELDEWASLDSCLLSHNSN